MKITMCIGAAALVVAAGCAGVQTSTESGGATARGPRAAASGLLYCATDKLDRDGDRLRCNWYRTQAEACLYGNMTVVDRNAITGDPQPAGRCMTGQNVIVVTPR